MKKIGCFARKLFSNYSLELSLPDIPHRTVSLLYNIHGTPAIVSVPVSTLDVDNASALENVSVLSIRCNKSLLDMQGQLSMYLILLLNEYANRYINGETHPVVLD